MSLFSYAAAQGSIRARLSGLLDRATWDRLMEVRTPAEFRQILTHTAAAAAVDDDGRLRLQILRGRIAVEGATLVRFLPRTSAVLLAWYNQRFEIENLKTVLRAVHYRLDRSRAASSLIRIPWTRFRWELLLEAASVPGIVELIPESPYTRPLENAMERYRQEGRLFHLEVAIDLFYFQRLVRLIESQNGKDEAYARLFLGRWIAIENLLWAYRYRIYGRMTPEEILNYTLHRAFAVGLDTIRRVALGSPLSAEAPRLGLSVSPGASELETLTSIEIEAERQRFQLASRTIARPLFHLGGVLAYLWLLEGEVRDLVVLVESKRAGLSSADIAGRLLRAEGIRAA